MSVHPEDAMAYAEQRHVDLERIAVALERIVVVLESVADAEHGTVRVRQVGALIFREDRP